MNNPLPLPIHVLTKPSGEHFPALLSITLISSKLFLLDIIYPSITDRLWGCQFWQPLFARLDAPPSMESKKPISKETGQ